MTTYFRALRVTFSRPSLGALPTLARFDAASDHAAVIERSCHIGRGNSNPFLECYNVLLTTEAPTLTAW